MSHHHLTVEEREIIALMSRHHTQGEIAVRICRSQSTISRELRRNRSEDGWYRPVAAHRRARKRRRDANTSRGRKMDHPEVECHVHKGLSWRWSPEQIAGRIRVEFDDLPDLWVSHETLYSWVWRDKRQGGSWHSCLRQGHKKHKRASQGARRMAVKPSPTEPGSMPGRRRSTPAAGWAIGRGTPSWVGAGSTRSSASRNG